MAAREQPVVPPGFTLSRVLLKQRLVGAYTDIVNSVAWTPAGDSLLTAYGDSTIAVWDWRAERVVRMLRGHTYSVEEVLVTPDGRFAVSCSGDRTIRVWKLATGRCIRVLEGHTDYVRSIAVTPDGEFVLSASDDATVRQWSLRTGQCLRTFEGHRRFYGIAVMPDGGHCLVGSTDHGIWAWNLQSGERTFVLEGHTDDVAAVAITPDGKTAVSASGDATVRVWDLRSGRNTLIFETHTSAVDTVSLSRDGKWVVSVSIVERRLLVWNLDSGRIVSEFPLAQTHRGITVRLPFHPNLPLLPIFDGHDGEHVRLYELDFDLMQREAPAPAQQAYATARIALVGDSGVGKSGLGWRLAHGKFREQSSTHGQQFWVVKELGVRREDGVECEAVLWDLAGQPDYRLVHVLFLDEADIALLLFDPTLRDDPLAPVEYWIRHLAVASQARTSSAGEASTLACETILVAARCDRGDPALSEAEMERFCAEHSIRGFVRTSAKNGIGISRLANLIRSTLPWSRLTTTVTTETFRRIKDVVLQAKQENGGRATLVAIDAIRQALSNHHPDEHFSDEEITTAAGHLSAHGYVRRITASTGETFFLLKPEVLANIASSTILEARRHPRGLGMLDEANLLAGNYSFPEFDGVSGGVAHTLLDATIHLLIRHNLCFRLVVADRSYFVFPSLINQKRPAEQEAQVDGDSSRIEGSVENTYSALVVLLAYTNLFVRFSVWRNEARFDLDSGEFCGVRRLSEGDGRAELCLGFGEGTTDETRQLFQLLIERFLNRRKLQIRRVPALTCRTCQHPFERSVVVRAFEDRLSAVFCSRCGARVLIPLASGIGVGTGLEAEAAKKAEMTADRRTDFEDALVWIKSVLQSSEPAAEGPSCFISYAHGEPANERWVLKLARHLRDADVRVFLDRWNNPPGSDLDGFIERIASADFVLAIGTESYLGKYTSPDADPVVAAELRLIHTRLRKRLALRTTVIPVLKSGTAQTSFPPLFENSVLVDFRREESYFERLFDLVMTLHRIPFDHPRADSFRSQLADR